MHQSLLNVLKTLWKCSSNIRHCIHTYPVKSNDNNMINIDVVEMIQILYKLSAGRQSKWRVKSLQKQKRSLILFWLCSPVIGEIISDPSDALCRRRSYTLSWSENQTCEFKQSHKEWLCFRSFACGTRTLQLSQYSVTTQRSKEHEWIFHSHHIHTGLIQICLKSDICDTNSCEPSKTEVLTHLNKNKKNYMSCRTES